MKRIVISVSNDLSTDQRVAKTAATLQKMGFDILLIGRKLPNSLPLERPYATRRMRLWFNKGPQFYANYNIRLFLRLLFTRADVLLANDLDTLPANYLISQLRGIPLVYDSHEYYTQVPELVSRPKVQRVWQSIERSIFPKLKHVYTVNESIAREYRTQYGVEVKVIRNLPTLQPVERVKSRGQLSLPEDKKVIVLQGAGINIHRGAEELIEALALLPEYFLAVIGSGDVVEQLKQRVTELNIGSRVLFQSKMPYRDMMQYTLNADLGVTLDKDTNLNYRYSLPNKIFDYLKAGLPVLSSNLPELRNIVETWNAGRILHGHEPEVIAQTIREMFADEGQILSWRENAKFAAAQLTWESQEPELVKIFEPFAR